IVAQQFLDTRAKRPLGYHLADAVGTVANDDRHGLLFPGCLRLGLFVVGLPFWCLSLRFAAHQNRRDEANHCSVHPSPPVTGILLRSARESERPMPSLPSYETANS